MLVEAPAYTGTSTSRVPRVEKYNFFGNLFVSFLEVSFWFDFDPSWGPFWDPL